MVHRILTVMVLAGAGLLVISCDKGGKHQQAPAEVGDVEQGDDAVSTTRGTADKNRHSGFGRAVTTVFGIKIPSGMVPAKGPEKVCRFEGTQPVPQVAHLVREQVHAKTEEREGEGYLFRFAAPRQLRTDKALAIRVFDSGDQTTLDIWLEYQHPETLPDKSSQTAFYGAKDPRPVHMKLDDKVEMAQTQKRRETLRILRKIENGEPLTPAEMTSEALH